MSPPRAKQSPDRILLSVPHMCGREWRYIDDAFADNWLSTVGPNIDAFEKQFSKLIRVPSLALCSGTAAIHLGLRLLGVGPGDEVLCPTFTFVATVNPVRYLGAEPVFVDSESASWNMDPALLDEALRDRRQKGKTPRAVVVAHMYGQCADMDRVMAVCRGHGVPVLEDAAEALGATYKGRRAGTLGDIGVYSFNGNKIITTTGGGMLVTRNQEWLSRARLWANQAREVGPGYLHNEVGYNYRLSNVLAGIGRGQLTVLDERVEQRRTIAQTYADAFRDVEGITPMPDAGYGVHTHWLSCFLIDEDRFGCSRDALIAHLDAAGIESRPLWRPMHRQPLFAGCACYGGAVSEELFAKGISLPSSSSLNNRDQLRVIAAVREAARLKRSALLT